MSFPREDYTFLEVKPTDDPKKFKVRFRYPGLGFCPERVVDEDTARLLEHARNAGWNEHIFAVNNVMRTK